MKSLLVAAGLFVGASAWADTVNATLDHTAGAQWGSNTGASTVDAEKEHYNNDAASAWAGCAYAKFSFTIPAGHTITEALLTYSVYQGGKSGRDDIIYYMAKDFDLDWATFAGQTGTDLRNAGSRAGKAVAAAATGGTGDRLNLSQNVTAAVKAIYEAGQSYILFQWTGNAGGADLYGKASANAPKLVITTTSESTYAVTFAETNDVAATVEIDGVDVTAGTSLVNGTYNFTATATGYQDYAGSFTVAGADQEVSFTMTPKSVYNYTVKGVDGSDNDLGTVSSGTGYADESVTYYYPEFVKVGTTLYTKNRNSGNPYWGASSTLDANNKEFSVTYGDGTISDVVFYKEAEEMEGFTAKTTNNATIRCSNGTGGISTTEVTLTTLASGKYTIFGQVWGTSGMTATIKANGVTVWQQATTGSLTGNTSAEFELSESTELTVITTAANDNRMLDLVYIVRTGDATTSVSPTIGATGYATYASDYALDFSAATGVKAYKATAAADGKVTMAEVTGTAAAGEGLFLQKTTGEISIPVVATGDALTGNLLVRGTDAAVEAESGYNKYVLGAEGESVAFYLINETAATVAKDKAYLKVTAGAGARLAIVFDGETTGIEAVAAQKANGEVYNLNGQRIAAPQKGLFIVNGKKVVLK